MRRSAFGHAAGPREKIAVLAPESLSDEELLAVVLRTGYAGCGVMDLSRRILREHPHGLFGMSYAALRRVKGLGPTRAAALLACREMARRESLKDSRPPLDSPARILERLPPEVLRARKEHFLAVYLNVRCQFLGLETVSIGTLSASLIHPREVFAPAIANIAAAVVVAHNHPSGDTSPSREDREATRRLARAGELLGIPVLDHLIVAEKGFFSFKENGLL